MILRDNEIYLYGPIAADKEDAYDTGAIDPEAWIAELHSLATTRKIMVRINSPGGSVFGGWSIHNAIRDFRKLGHTVTTMVDGAACSAASYIMLAGKPILMSDNAHVMIHLPMSAIAGNALEMAKHIETLEKVTDGLIKAYQERTGLSASAIRQMLEAETWMSATDALAMKFIDGIIDEKTSALDFELSNFVGNCPKAVLEKAREPIEELMSAVFQNYRRAKDAGTEAEFDRYRSLAASAVRRVLKKPGLRSTDLGMIDSVTKRWPKYYDPYGADEYGY